MKRSLIILITFVISFFYYIPGLSQIRIEDTGSKEHVLVKGQYASVTGSPSTGYILNIRDWRTNISIPVYLGENANTSIETLKGLMDWMEKSENGEYATITDILGNVRTIYNTADCLYIGTADGEYIRHEIRQTWMKAFIGTTTGADRSHSDNEKTLYGYVSRRVINKAIKLMAKELECDSSGSVEINDLNESKNMAVNFAYLSSEVTAIPKAFLYRIPEKYYEQLYNLDIERNCLSEKRLSYKYWEEKRIRKPITLQTVGITKSVYSDNDYDTYIIKYNDLLYMLPMKYTENTRINPVEY